MITFCGFSNRSSGQIRGKQVSTKIEGADFLDIDRLDYRVPHNKTVIHVRKFRSDHAEFVKKMGGRVGFDVSDNPVTDFLYGRVKEDDFSRYVHKSIDFYIVNNDVTVKELSKHTDRPIYVIPHHNCNFKKVHKKLRKPKNLGYIGLPEQSISEGKLDNICKKFNLNFINRDIKEFSKFDDVFSEIDIGLVYFDLIEEKKELQEKILKYKPVTKLCNFQSYGIPTVCLPYESFKQFGEGKNLFVKTIEEVEGQIDRLMSDDFYESLSRDSVVVGEKFHIENVVDYYKRIVER